MKKCWLTICAAAFLSMLLALPVVGFASGDVATDIFVSANGNDTTGGGTQTNPYATLNKAAEVINAAAKGQYWNIQVMSDLTSTSCARIYNAHVTLRSFGNSTYTVSRGDTFKTQRDNERFWYNPALIEIGGELNQYASSLRLENIVLDDAGKKMGTSFVQAASGSDNNEQVVQDAMIATYNGTATIYLGSGAVLRNFGGMSAVRIADGKLVMESGSVIEDTTVTDRTKSANDNGPAGAVWMQGGSVTLEEGSRIQNVIGRAIYADKGTAVIGGTISNISNDEHMWEGSSGLCVHLRNGAKGTLTSTGRITDVRKVTDVKKQTKNLFHVLKGCELTLDEGSAIQKNNSPNYNIIYAKGAQGEETKVNINGLIADNDCTGVHILQTDSYTITTIGKTGEVLRNKCYYGAIYLNGKEEFLHHYGKVNDNTTTDRGGGIVLANNGADKYATMYEGAQVNGNSSTQTGGGIMVSMGTFIMQGGTISGNTATDEGGGAYVRKGGKFIMNGGEITGNTTNKWGGGVALDAGDYGTPARISRVELNGGTVSGNRSKAGQGHDLGIGTEQFGRNDDRFLLISDEAVIGDYGVYMVTDAKTITPSKASLDIKLLNAEISAVTSLNNAAQELGWTESFASFWVRREGSIDLNIKVRIPNENLPVYALVAPVASNARAALDYDVIRADVVSKEVLLSLAGTANGSNVILVQPKQNNGSLVMSGPGMLYQDDGTEKYPVEYTEKLSLAQSLVSQIADLSKEEISNLSFELEIEADSRLNILEAAKSFSSSVFELKGTSIAGNKAMLKLVIKEGAKLDNMSAVITTSCELPASEFKPDDVLVTVGTLRIQGAQEINVLIPSNAVKTMMTDEANPAIGVDLPQTGDNSPLFTAVLSLLLAMTGIVVLIKRRYA